MKKIENFVIGMVLIAMVLALIMAFVVILIIGLDLIDNEITRTEKVQCYDRWDNEIIGEKCIEEIRCGWFSKNFNSKHCYKK